MSTLRRSYETGHKPKCLVIVDDTAEWDRAVHYASRWAVRCNGAVVMLRIIETEDQNQHVIEQDVDIALLVLAASPGAEGPGPLITTVAKTVGSFPVPVVIVPGDLSDADIDALS